MDDIKAVVRVWADSFDRHDIEALQKLYREDAVEHQVALQPVRGRPAIVNGLRTFFAAFPDSFTTVDNLFADGEWGIVEWRGGGTHLGTFAGHPPTGGRYELLGCGFFRISAGLIAYQRGYWDKASWYSQLGIPLD